MNVSIEVALEEINFLSSQGQTPIEISDQLKVNPATLSKALAKHGYLELASEFMAAYDMERRWAS